MDMSNAVLFGVYAVIMVQTIALLREHSIFKVLIVHMVPMILTFSLVTCGALVGGNIWAGITMILSLLAGKLCALCYASVTAKDDEDD